MTNEVFTDKRLLGALDYIDERFIAEVTESYTFEAPGEYKRDKKTVFKAYRQFAALAACLLLISAAFPVLNYAVQRFGTGIWEGFAGAGTEELEVPTQPETQALETENEITEAEVIDFDKALERYADMSAEEIYADVLKGGWIVIKDLYSKDVWAPELWQLFLNNVDLGNPATVLIAYYSEYSPVKLEDLEKSEIPYYSSTVLYQYTTQHTFVDGAVIILTKLEYNGETFVRYEKGYNPKYNCISNEYLYLHNEPSPNGKSENYYLSNDPKYFPKPSTSELIWNFILGEGVISIRTD